MPLVSNNVLLLSNSSVNEVTQPIAQAAVGEPSNSTSASSNGNEQGIVGKVVARYIASLKKQRLLYVIFLALWLFVVLIALLIIYWHAYGVDAVEEYRRRRFQKEKNGAITPWFHRDVSGSGHGPIRPASLAAPPHHSTSLIAEAKERRVEGVPYGEEEKSQEDGSDLRSFTPLATPKRSNFFSAVLPFNRETNDDSRYPKLQSPALDEGSNTGADPKDVHPLARTNPRFQQSWDSFLDSRRAADVEKNGEKKGGALNWNRAKLRNDARRAMKRDPFEYTPPEASPGGFLLFSFVLQWCSRFCSYHRTLRRTPRDPKHGDIRMASKGPWRTSLLEDKGAAV